jgi:hypothetical protein
MTDCVQSLPDGARLAYAGCIPTLSQPNLRICIRGLAPAVLPDYLARIGWSGNQDLLRKDVSVVAPMAKEVTLQLDVTDRLMPRIGLEWYGGASPAESRPTWIRLLDHLAADGRSDPDKRGPLLSWPGADYRDEPEPSIIVRHIHHMKLTYGETGPTEAKAYFGFWRASENFLASALAPF